MNILIATNKTQGQRDNDFNWCEEKEPVRYGFTCGNWYPDDNCGCGRSMSGVNTHKGTTTVEVMHTEMSGSGYVKLIVDSYENSGFTDMKAQATKDAMELLKVAAKYTPGTVLEYRGEFKEREQ